MSLRKFVCPYAPGGLNFSEVPGRYGSSPLNPYLKDNICDSTLKRFLKIAQRNMLPHSLTLSKPATPLGTVWLENSGIHSSLFLGSHRKKAEDSQLITVNVLKMLSNYFQHLL